MDVTLHDGKVVQLKRLTVADIEQWLEEMSGLNGKNESELQQHAFEIGLFGSFAISDAIRLSSLTKEDIPGRTPEDIDLILDEAKKLNKRFFQLQEKALKTAQNTL